MEELTSDDLLHLHHIVEKQFNVFKGVKDAGLVQAIAERPTQKLYGSFEPYKDLFTKAASLMEGLIRLHPFYDGNKRTALLATIAFLQL
ncbi:MAG TPA: Fic family protein [Candidatus Nitrosotalea sp.]|nr:Fic family protein [Candidatus Nitrosotalea sp.]